MAKGRKLTTSRSELYLGYNQSHVASNGAPELAEEEVWSIVDDTVNGEWTPRAYSNTRCTPRAGTHRHQVGGLSLAFDEPSNTSSQRIMHQYHPQDSLVESPRGRHVATSAPMNVPDWSKIYRVNSVETTFYEPDDGLNDSEMVPPHEYLARSRKMAANSVFEGVGRTLKGRDLSRVRDAVWSQTGFDG